MKPGSAKPAGAGKAAPAVMSAQFRAVVLRARSLAILNRLGAIEMCFHDRQCAGRPRVQAGLDVVVGGFRPDVRVLWCLAGGNGDRVLLVDPRLQLVDDVLVACTMALM